jgi:lipoprotein-releasing system ATP-binding protein
MSTPVTPLVQAVGLHKRYVDGPSVVEVLVGLDLDVYPGDRLAVVGASGVGKSTLLHMLGCLDRPSAGRVLFDGGDVFERSEASLAAFRSREIGFVFQFHQLLGDFTALENVELAGRIGREPRGQVRARASELLDRVGLGARLHHRPGELSGGEQQRVAVARAVMRRPRLVLADEPTGNLDPATGERVRTCSSTRTAKPGRRSSCDPQRAIRDRARAVLAAGARTPRGGDRGRGVGCTRHGGASRMSGRPGWGGLALGAWLAAAAASHAAVEPTVVRVTIEGNVRVEDDAIRVNLESRPGTPVDPARVDRDVRAIYAMGFFDQVDVEVRDEPDGAVLVSVESGPWFARSRSKGSTS